MKRLMLIVAMAFFASAGGCARLRKDSGSVGLPSGARMSPTTAASVQAPVAVTPPPAEPRRSWWRRKPGETAASVPAPVVQPVQAPAPPPAPAAVPVVTPPKEPRRHWWAKKPKEPPAPVAATPRPVRVYRMKPGDPVIIALRGLPMSAGGQQNIEGILDENGGINLPFLNSVQAGGKTPSELEREIRDRYINEGYYRTLGINIIIPTQSYFVRGEVRGAGRFPLTGGVTILQAVAAAGGFTEFANSRRVELLRGDERILVNVRDLEKHPARDKELEAGDVIIVPRSPF